MFADINGTSIYYEMSGDPRLSNQPILFVLPGGPGRDHQSYKQNSKEFEQFSCVVYLDPRGCGLSDKSDPDSCTMENYIEDVEALRKYLGFEKICLLGTSYGSMTAIGYAIRYSGNLEKLILVAGAVSYRFIEDAKNNLERLGTPDQKKMCEHLWNGSFENEDHLLEFVRIMRPLYSQKMSQPLETIEEVKKTTNHSYQLLNLGFKTFLSTFNFEDDLHRILCETIVIVGSEDWINDPKHAKLIASKIPKAKLFILNGGHFVSIDCHDDYIKIVRDFIRCNKVCS